MDTQLAAQIAAEIAKRLPTFSWSVIAIQSAVLLLVAIAGAFVGEYLRGRAKNLATKADFDSLLEQLEQNTRLVERVRAEIGQQDWAQREWTTLRRIKLEELLNHALAAERYLGDVENKAIEGSMSAENDVRDEMMTVATLFFPELRLPITHFYVAIAGRLKIALKLAQDVSASQDDMAQRLALVRAFVDSRDFHVLIKAHDDLRNASRQLLLQIAGV